MTETKISDDVAAERRKIAAGLRAYGKALRRAHKGDKTEFARAARFLASDMEAVAVAVTAGDHAAIAKVGG